MSVIESVNVKDFLAHVHSPPVHELCDRQQRGVCSRPEGVIKMKEKEEYRLISCIIILPN